MLLLMIIIVNKVLIYLVMEGLSVSKIYLVKVMYI